MADQDYAVTLREGDPADGGTGLERFAGVLRGDIGGSQPVVTRHDFTLDDIAADGGGGGSAGLLIATVPAGSFLMGVDLIVTETFDDSGTFTFYVSDASDNDEFGLASDVLKAAHPSDDGYLIGNAAANEPTGSGLGDNSGCPVLMVTDQPVYLNASDWQGDGTTGAITIFVSVWT